jgi:outer membrane biosynthesis protein TonB
MRVVACLALTSGMALAGCGRGDEPTAPAQPPAPAQEQVMPEPAPPPKQEPEARVEPDASARTPEPEEKAEIIEDYYPTDLPIPEDARTTSLPKDVPVPAGAHALHPPLLESGITQATLALDDSAASVKSFYMTGLLKDGWTTQPALAAGTDSMILARKGSRELSVVISEVEGKTHVLLLEREDEGEPLE